MGVCRLPYNIYNMVLGILGGAGNKRKKTDDGEVRDTSRIPDIIGEMNEKAEDCHTVKLCLATKHINVADVLEKMPLGDSIKLKDLLTKHETRGHSDFVVRAMSKYVPSVVALEEDGNRISNVHSYE